DSKFFILLCQALGIPFLIEDEKLKIKKCGFRDDIYMEKLNLIKDLYENHYVNINKKNFFFIIFLI
ncbi:hypothetical protein PIROE2DRAFT_44328, partial [Piromyces sp. E2]